MTDNVDLRTFNNPVSKTLQHYCHKKTFIISKFYFTLKQRQDTVKLRRINKNKFNGAREIKKITCEDICIGN